MKVTTITLYNKKEYRRTFAPEMAIDISVEVPRKGEGRGIWIEKVIKENPKWGKLESYF